MIWLLLSLYWISNVTWQLLIKKAVNSGRHYASVSAAIMLVASVVSLTVAPVFEWQWPSGLYGYLLPLISTILLASSSRLEIIARQDLPVSEVVIVNRLRAVMFILGAIIILGERPGPIMLLGAAIIVFANLLAAYNGGKFIINKSFWQLMVASLLVVISTFIDVEASKQFNLGFFLSVSFLLRALFFVAIDPVTRFDVLTELRSGGKLRIIATGSALALSVIVTIIGFQRFEYSQFEPLRSTATFLTILIASRVNSEDNHNILRKLLAAILVVVGVYLISS